MLKLGLGEGVGVREKVWVKLNVGFGVAEKGGVSVWEMEGVAVEVGGKVRVTEAVGVPVWVMVGVCVGVIEGVRDGVAVGVSVWVMLGVCVGVKVEQGPFSTNWTPWMGARQSMPSVWTGKERRVKAA